MKIIFDRILSSISTQNSSIFLSGFRVGYRFNGEFVLSYGELKSMPLLEGFEFDARPPYGPEGIPRFNALVVQISSYWKRGGFWDMVSRVM